MQKEWKLTGGELTIPVPKELDHHSANKICVKVDEMIQTLDILEIVFDFKETEFCDSSGIGMLMGRYKMMKAVKGSVRGIDAKERVYKILEMSGVTKIIEIERGRM